MTWPTQTLREVRHPPLVDSWLWVRRGPRRPRRQVRRWRLDRTAGWGLSARRPGVRRAGRGLGQALPVAAAPINSHHCYSLHLYLHFIFLLITITQSKKKFWKTFFMPSPSHPLGPPLIQWLTLAFSRFRRVSEMWHIMTLDFACQA